VAEVGRILIAGGGIAGLCLAAALDRHGFAAELVERSPDWPAAGAGITLHANAGRMLRTLGLGDAIARAAAPLPRWSFLDQRGDLLCETDLEDLWGEAGPGLGITRVRLQEILAGAARGVTHRLGVAVTSLNAGARRVSAGFDRWHSGRVVLAGDAAHAAPPHMGEGGALAMEDAVVLAGLLRSASTVEAALAAYEARRRPRAEWVQQQSRIAARSWVLPPAQHDTVLRERGDQSLRDRYRPLIAAP
jgi:2-polyprenyl-6-methoxyphenol hydroxylase-like FAD-dependent oxidoreductase